MRISVRSILLLILILGAVLLPGSAAWAGAVARGDLLLSQHRPASSLEAYRHAETLPGAAPVSLLREGRALLAREQWRDALGVFRRVVDRGLGGSEAAMGLAESYHQLGEVDTALTTLKMELERRPGNGAAWALLVERAAAAGMRPGDVDALLEGVGPPVVGAVDAQRTAYLWGACLVDPLSEEGRAALGMALTGPDPRVSALALELLSAAEIGDPAERGPAVARALMAQGMVGPALAVAERIDGGPDTRADALAIRGYGLMRIGRTREAEHLLREAMQLAPELRLAEFGLGMLLRTRGDEEEALDLLLRAASRHPPNPAIYAELANSLAALGDFGSAERAMRLAVEAAPEDAGVRLALVSFHVDSQYRPSTILEDAREAVRLSGRSAEALSALGWALQLSGQPREALEALLEARDRAPRVSQTRYRLGSVWESLGEIGEAEREYALAIELDGIGEVARRARAALSELEESGRTNDTR
jgi:tetratricopeptide (TPR) repeat protein